MDSKKQLPVLLTSVFIIASCGILYELLISSISTYFLGSSILQFSVTIGLFMFFMGVGSFFSKFFNTHLLDWFVGIEIVLGFVGGLSALILYFSYSLTENYYLVAFVQIAILGSLIGLEIPLVTRIINQYTTLKDTVAQIFSFDYIGALLASVLFPLILLPYMGIMRTSFLIGLLNLGVAFFNIQFFENDLINSKGKKIATSVLIAILVAGFAYSFQISSFFEQFIYQDNIVLSQQSPYQKIVVTEWNDDKRLFLNGSLQFSTTDEYRYHESLVHLPMSLTQNREQILILGGGDGLAIRELLRYKNIGHIDLVDLDAAVTDLAKNNPIFKVLNQNSLNNAKVKIFNQDAFNFIKQTNNRYSLIIIDLPDPHDTSLAKLYSKEFYEMVKKCLSADGVMVTQATSPYFAKKTFWCIENTLADVFENVVPYTAYVPAFGQWGFVIASQNLGVSNQEELIGKIQNRIRTEISFENLKFLTPELITSLFNFPKDLQKPEIESNTLDTQIIVQYYEESLKSWE
jgi:spermidine synthase